MQGNVVRGKIHWWELKWAVPRLLGGIEAGVLGGLAMPALLVSGSPYSAQPATIFSHALFGAGLGYLRSHLGARLGRRIPAAPSTAPGDWDGVE